MAYIVYVRNTEDGKVESFGAFDKPPFIIAQDGTKFANIPAPYFQFSDLTKKES